MVVSLQVLSRHPLEANLASLSLETLPKFYFLNYNLVAMNLAHNYMAVSAVFLLNKYLHRSCMGSLCAIILIPVKICTQSINTQPRPLAIPMAAFLIPDFQHWKAGSGLGMRLMNMYTCMYRCTHKLEYTSYVHHAVNVM